ncbi:MAG: hypothetical protein AAGJ28_08425, partial [Pseudomonadota bacterium]
MTGGDEDGIVTYNASPGALLNHHGALPKAWCLAESLVPCRKPGALPKAWCLAESLVPCRKPGARTAPKRR